MSLLSVLAEPLLKIVDKVIPDPEAKARAQLEILRLEKEGTFKELDAQMQIALGQLRVNEEEAKSPSFFRGGWRPSVGWICSLGLGYQFLGRPLIHWGVSWYGTVSGWDIDLILQATPPSLDMPTLLTVLGGMLGLGTMRGIEKIKGLS